MKREIKFRAHVRATGKVLGVKYIDFGRIRTVNAIVGLDGDSCVCRKLSDVDLLQYTGLKDKNGKELYYDSDIVLLDGSDKKFKAIKDDFGVPVWMAGEGAMIIDFKDWFLSQRRDSFEIIGNIYTTPELLETK